MFSSNNNIVIYSAIFGEYDNIKEPKIELPADLILFTDKEVVSQNWNIKKKEPLFNDSVRDARRYKILPHEFFSEYEYSIWVDGNMVIKSDITKLIDLYLNDNCSFASFSHFDAFHGKRDCIYDEANFLINQDKPRDDPNIIKKQIDKYKKEGYPKKNGLIASGILPRRHNDPYCIKVMEDWWKEIKNGSKRDQVSFNYAAWKNNFKYKYIEGDYYNNKFIERMAHKK